MISLLHSTTTKKENVEMSIKKTIVLACILGIGLFLLAACAGATGPVGPAGPAGPIGPAGPAGAAGTNGTNPSATDLTCTQCHNNTTLLDGKKYAWAVSRHGTVNQDWLAEGSQQACSGCHSGAAFVARVAANQSFADWGSATNITLPDPSPQTCRTCHNIHTTYTKDDFGLRTIAPVKLAISGQTFDKGMGNLCAACHQSRRLFDNFAAKDASGNAIAGKVDVSARFNPHLSGQADFLLGVGGGGTVTGSPASHYTMNADSCVSCHLGKGNNHTFVPSVSTCVACHADAKADANGVIDVNLDSTGVGGRAKIQAKYDALKAALTAAGQIDKTGADVAAKGVDAAKAFPLWVYGYMTEDGSMGVHNPKYANALLDAALAGMK
jgi:hypothetical protein